MKWLLKGLHLAFWILFCGSAFAGDVTVLKCDLVGSSSSRVVSLEPEKIRTTVDLVISTQNGVTKFEGESAGVDIHIRTAYPASAAGKVYNESTPQKWDVRTVVENPSGNGVMFSTQLVINRVTGGIYVKTIDSAQIKTLEGSCQKIANPKNKF